MNNNYILEYFTKMANNFYDTMDQLENFFKERPEMVSDFNVLYHLIQDVFASIKTSEYTSRFDLLRDVFYLLYKSDISSEQYVAPYPLPSIKQYFDKDNAGHGNINFFDTVFNACLYESLCLYLHNTKRINPMTLKEFLLRHTNDEYLLKCHEIVNNEKIDKIERDRAENILKAAVNKLRQTRYRILSKREAYVDNKEWSAIRKDQEFEWALYFILDDDKIDPEIRDTYKRLHNLNKDIDQLLQTDSKTYTPEKLKADFDKFYSKLNKIKYNNYLKTWNFILNRLNEEKRYYGHNIYRLEKESRIFENTETINKLLECESVEEEKEILLRNFLLRDIWFPKLKEDFNTVPFGYLEYIFDMYKSFFEELTFKSRFLLEKMVENKVFGEDWEDFFYEVLSDMAPCVFYVPSDVDFEIRPGADEKFIKLFTYDIERYLKSKFPIKFI